VRTQQKVVTDGRRQEIGSEKGVKRRRIKKGRRRE
jgi:hypothetical protein